MPSTSCSARRTMRNSDTSRRSGLALDRPAFYRPADIEGNFQDQLKAIEDTSRFLRTGYLYDRSGNLVTGVLPYRRYGEEYAKRAEQILRALGGLEHHLRRTLQVMHKPGSSEQVTAAAQLNTKRLKVLNEANKLFQRYDIQPVDVY